MFVNRLPFLAIWGLALVSVACGGGEGGRGATGGQVDAQLVQAGRKIFHGEGTCVVCHGPEGKGIQNLCPDLTDAEWLHIEQPLSVGKIKQIVRNGVNAPKRHRGNMPPFGKTLTEDKITAVATYVYSLSQK